MGTRFQTAASPLPSPGTGFAVGFDEEPFLLEGWGPRESHPPGPIACRRLESNARFRMWVDPKATVLKILLLVPGLDRNSPFRRQDCPYRAEVFFENQPIGEMEVQVPQWVLRRFLIPAVSQGRVAEFAIAAKPPAASASGAESGHIPKAPACCIAAARLESAGKNESAKQ